MTIADRIRNKRESLHLSQEELAKKCGYADKTSISKIENAGDNITLKKIKRIADALGVSHRYLMGWEIPPVASGHTPAEIIVVEDPNREELDKALDLFRRFQNLPPEKQTALLTLLEVPRNDT